MAELITVDTSGIPRFIWTQERDDTCGPACVYMIERETRLMCPAGGETRIRQITELLPQGYTDGAGVEDYSALALALTRIGIPAEARYIDDFALFVQRARFPFITRIQWADGGGHFVVCVGISAAGGLICLDPLFGLVESATAHLPAYTVHPTFQATRGQGSPAGGVFSGHTVIPNG